ncbi:MAG TPA: hypothetical protein VKW09_01510 [bacterium]|nr:hypothetical protein [bacterium]
MCITVISVMFAFQLALFVAVFLLIRLRHRWSGRVTAWSIAGASVLFVASFVFLMFLGVGYGCG